MTKKGEEKVYTLAKAAETLGMAPSTLRRSM